MNYVKKILEDYKEKKLSENKVESFKTIPVPEILLNTKEIETLKKKRVRTSYTPVLNCKVYHIQEDKLCTVLSADGANRSIAVRIVAKALALRPKSTDGKVAMLAIASGLINNFPTEADRVLRAV